MQINNINEETYNKLYVYIYHSGLFALFWLEKFSTYIQGFFIKIFGNTKIFIHKGINKFVKMRKRNISQISRGIRQSVYLYRKDVAQSSENPLMYRVTSIIKLLLRIFKWIVTILINIFKLATPIIGLYILIFSVEFFMNQSMALNVNLYGQDLGLISDQSIFDIAESEMQKDIVYFEEDELIYSTPIFQIKFIDEAEKNNLMNASQLREKIIRATGEDIGEAHGVYVGNVFYGAVSNPDNIVNALEELKKHYMKNVIDEKIDFAEEIQIKESIYLNNSIRDEADIIKTLTGEKEGAVYHIVRPGDSPWQISVDNNMTVDDLEALNPDLYDKMRVGEEVLIKNKVSFLTVKSTHKIKYEVPISFSKELQGDKSKNVGEVSVVQAGVDGIAEVEAEVTSINGAEISQVEVGRATTQAPVNEIRNVGVRTTIDGKTVYLEPTEVTIGSGQFRWPVASGGRVTCQWLCYRGHMAMDIQSFYGDYTLAADSGVVETVSYSRYGYGYHVIINHLNGYKTLYGHNSALLVKVGQMVEKGDPIAKQGNTGNVQGRTGIHLHFEIIKNGVKVNPANYL